MTEIETPPPCPTCGARAIAISVGIMTTEYVGEMRTKESAIPGKLPSIECENGHWYHADARGAFPGGPPFDVTVRLEPRL